MLALILSLAYMLGVLLFYALFVYAFTGNGKNPLLTIGEKVTILIVSFLWPVVLLKYFYRRIKTKFT